jgi:hypothetical protein
MAYNSFLGQTLTSSIVDAQQINALALDLTNLDVSGTATFEAGIRCASQAAGVTYAGGIPSITQVGTRNATVTSNYISANIQTSAEPFADGASEAFTVSCSVCDTNDLVLVNTVDSDSTPVGDVPTICLGTTDGSFVLQMTNNSGSSLNGSFTIGYLIIKRV